jgi:hypothetical protein
MSKPHTVIVTKEQCAEWRSQAREYERLAASFLRRAIAGEQLLSTLESEDPDTLAEDVTPVANSSFMGAIREIAATVSQPISKPTLKKMLLDKGFSASQVGGPYFYVALSKLAKKERISIQQNGLIWKGRVP